MGWREMPSFPIVSFSILSFVYVPLGLFGCGNLKISADLLRDKIQDFAMPGHRRRLACISIDIDRVIATFPQ